MHKFFIALLIFFFSCLSVYAQIPDFPPELQWWICEIQKADSSIEVSDFLLIDKREIEYAREYEYLVEKYPVFRKWNYFGDKYGYYDIATELVKTEEGKYIVYRDIDSVFAVFNRDGNLLFWDSFGSQSGLNGFAWSRDNIVIAVGIELISDAGKNVNLVILRYPYFNNEVRQRRGLDPSSKTTKTCIVCLPQPTSRSSRHEENYHKTGRNV